MTYEEKKSKLKGIDMFGSFGGATGPNYKWLKSELEKAWAALEFYADEKNYKYTSDRFSDEPYILIKDDQGKRAREALAE